MMMIRNMVMRIRMIDDHQHHHHRGDDEEEEDDNSDKPLQCYGYTRSTVRRVLE